MKKAFLCLLATCLCGIGSFAQQCAAPAFTFSTPIPDGDPAGVTVNLPVTVSGNLGQQYALDSVHVLITHTYVGDLKVLLSNPAGDTVVLFDQPGVPASTYGCGNDDVDATFSSYSNVYAEDICNALPALSGNYKPITPLSALFNGTVAGTWTFTAMDMAGSDIGTINGVTLYFTPLWYTDADGDGFGAGTGIRACNAPTGKVSANGDCNDANPDIHPGAFEICGNKIDEDCQGGDVDYFYQPLLSAVGGNGFCAGDSALILIQPFATGDSVVWYHDQTPVPAQTGNFFYASEPGSYTANIIMSHQCRYIPNILQIVEYAQPQPSISLGGQGLYGGNYAGYVWYAGGSPIPGANDPYWVPQNNGSYQVEVTDSNGCTALSAPITVQNASLAENAGNASFFCYPNPATDAVYIQTGTAKGNLELMDMQGKIIRKAVLQSSPFRLNVEGVAPGVYILKWNNRSQRLLIQ